jgi:hypothetical protein
MTNLLGRMTAALLLATAIALPATTYAQDKKEAPKAAAPAKPAAPAAKPAQPAARPQPQQAPRVQAPQPHIQAPQRQQAAPQRQFTPPQRQQAAPQRQAPVVNRSVQQEQPRPNVQQRVQERVQRREERVQRREERIQQRQQAQPNIQRQQAQPNVQTQSRTLTQQSTPLTRAQTRQFDRTLTRQERRELRSLPADQRAARRQELFQQRTTTGAATPNVQSKALTNPATTLTSTRRNGQARITTQAARQGRFASAFASASASSQQAGTRSWRQRGAWTSARRAWRNGLRAAFVPWYGPVFWPYAYEDIFDYAFWPDGYDDGYWYYAYDDFVDGLFWGEAGPPADYAYAPAVQDAPRANYATAQQLCNAPGSGVTAWPLAEITQKVGLNGEQKLLLDQLRNAGNKAAAAFKASCPQDTAFPLTPPGRLTSMLARLDATLQAVQTVRPAMDAFYNSLSDEQKARFNELGPKTAAKSADQAQASAQDPKKACEEQKPGLTNLPIEKIEDAVKPNDAQAANLSALEDATGKAVSILQSACPADTPMTPPGRLEAMENRLQAMIEAANTVKPALETFYGSLSGEQKARFNVIGRTLAQNNG